MDRRALLKSSAVLFAGMGLSRFSSAANATDTQYTANFVWDKEHPLRLNFNENSLGMSPNVLKAMHAVEKDLMRYPFLSEIDLKNTLAQIQNIPADGIVLGAGSAQVIQAAVQYGIVSQQKKGQAVQIIIPHPTFHYAELYAKPFGIDVHLVPLDNALETDLATMKKKVSEFKGSSIVYLCNPNNPTGLIIPAKDIRDWVKSASKETLFIIDEAYGEYVNDPRFESATKLIEEGHKNVIVTRTFSKIFAMAGLRLGYGITHPETAKVLGEYLSFDNINLYAAVAGIASLKDEAFIQKSLTSNSTSYQMIENAFKEMKIEYLPSNTNFVLHRIKIKTENYQKKMAEENVLVGRLFPGTEGWTRLTLGTPEEMKVFIQVLQQLHQEGLV